jgi:benzoyl-CoA 2,3-dioxygenase component B
VIVANVREPPGPQFPDHSASDQSLCVDEDRGFVASLMRRVTEQGKIAGWTAPPEIGINSTPLDYDYVRLN